METVHILFDGGSTTWVLSSLKALTKTQCDKLEVSEQAKAAIWAEHEKRFGKVVEKPTDVQPEQDN